MNIQVLAQDIMDLYYQDYKAAEDFFDLDHFVRQVKYSYDRLLKEEYERRRQELRQEGIVRELIVTLDQSWLSAKEFDIKGDTTELDLEEKVFSFPFDTNSIGVQDVVALDYACILARATESELWMLKYAPKTDTTFWYVKEAGKIGIKKACGKGRIKVLYVPSISDKMDISDALASAIQKDVLLTMMQARQGTVINETNDGNQNKSAQTELNQDQVK